MVAQEEQMAPTCFLRDRDTKFTRQFDGIFRTEGITPIKLPPKSPNLNAFCERVIQSLQHEALDHFIVLGERHLNYIVREWVRYYHELRPHQGLGNVPPTAHGEASTLVDSLPLDDVVCHQRLGGLLKHYERRAA
jgi:putative transposase